jgi:hypothetical protein
MTNRSLKMGLNVLGYIAATLAFLLLPTTPALGQKGQNPTADSARTRMTIDGEREAAMDSLTAPGSKTDPKHLSAAQAQIQEDFVQILTLHNRMATVASGHEAIDYKLVSESLIEIRKRAARVQQTLFPTKVAGEHQNQPKRVKYEDAQIRQALAALCLRIKSFVTNPVIENPGTVDSLQLSKASDDLSGVIALSGEIKKISDRLSKASP